MSISLDVTGIDALSKVIARLDGLGGEWGFLSGKARYEDGVSVAKVAAIHEAKDGFFTRAVEMFSRGEGKKEFEAVIKGLLDDTMKPEDAVKRLSQMASREVVKMIDSDNKRKTGLMRRSVRWRVKDKDRPASSGRGDRQV